MVREAIRLYGGQTGRLGPAIAACALTWDAALWTLRAEDFRDVPGLEVRGG